jgi:peptidoglycan hydrolase CwlO-like protein
MRKIFFAIFFSIFTVAIFTVAIFGQDLKNPRIESTNGSSYSSGNYLLFIDPGKYIKPSNLSLSDLENLLKDWKDAKTKITAQEKQLSEQKKEIDELKRIVATQQRQFDEQHRKIEELQRKVK